MTLVSSGTMFGHYEIQSLLGAGGPTPSRITPSLVGEGILGGVDKGDRQ